MSEIRSKVNTHEFDAHYDEIFRKKIIKKQKEIEQNKKKVEESKSNE